MATKVFGDLLTKYDTITYQPYLQTTNDLIAAVDNIAVVAKPANAQYSAALALPAPSDARLAVLMITARLSATIDAFNVGAAHLYVQCYVDDPTGLLAARQLFNLDLVAPAGNNLAVQSTQVGNKETIFNLLKDGGAHTFYFFLWVDAGNVNISLLQLWEAVGSSSNNAQYVGQALKLQNFIGTMQWGGTWDVIGTGAVNYASWDGVVNIRYTPGTYNWAYLTVVASGVWYFCFGSSVVTDIGYVYEIQIRLRSEQ